MKSYIYCIYKKIRKILRPVKRLYRRICTFFHVEKEIRLFKKKLNMPHNDKRVFYLGTTENNNLGDNAQFYCITKWIKKHLSDYTFFYNDATTIVAPNHKWLHIFIQNYKEESDIIIFQSGYTTQDLGGNHELMHRLIADSLPNAKILMMPQTIFFQHEENKIRTSKSYDKCHKMLFLARDRVSYQMALEMFPHIQVEQYPDIVTTLIGKFQFDHHREKIFICRRNDEERFYSEDEIMNLKDRLQNKYQVEIGDTQSRVSGRKTRSNIKHYLFQEIERLSHFKVVITDRYHGTIFALCANTPVIIIKTNDHKVTTGIDWFKGVYDKHVYLASSLDDAYAKAIEIYNHFEYRPLSSYFQEKYYDNLLALFEKCINK